MKPDSLPLEGILVLDFSQFLAGPMAAVRLGDLGARVIKIERPDGGDIGRRLAFGGIVEDGDTLSFHITNRNKESFSADLKNPLDKEKISKLLERADVVIQNFRPGVMDRLGFGYEVVSKTNPKVIYASISGYGSTGPWAKRPGQDLLAQSLSGLPWLNGSFDSPPIPVGIAIADIVTSIHCAHGITAALLKRERTGFGGQVETSLMESMLDLQFELVSARLNDDSILVERGAIHSAHAFLQAPYGVYPTADGYLALAMGSVTLIGELIGLGELSEFADPESWWSEKTKIIGLLTNHLKTMPTEHWLELLDASDVWCAPVLTLSELVQHEGFLGMDMSQQVKRESESGENVTLFTTRAPVRFDGKPIKIPKGAPRIGQHNSQIEKEFLGGNQS